MRKQTLKRYQWISNHYGPMGYFTPAQKAGFTRSQANDPDSPFTPDKGHWREVPQEETEAFNRYIGQLAYEQS